jgi:excinuclease ABC subunit C
VATGESVPTPGLRPPRATIPDTPGSYQFKDRDGRVIYVGKAASLRQRINSYFADPATQHPRTAQMVATARSVEWIEVRSEVDALMLEYNLIKTHRPRFNVRLRDDKSYPYLALTVDQQYPRALVMRGTRRAGTRYFGPFAHAYAIRQTLDELLRSFPVRTCSDAKLERHKRQGRPCLLFHIEKCSGPCVGAVDDEQYSRHVEALAQFLEGESAPIVGALEAAMLAAADELEFEKAARLRDRLAAVRRAMERQQIVGEPDDDLDVIATAGDELEWAVQVFHVRKGRVVGRNGVIVERVEDLTDAEFLSQILERLYASAPVSDPPKEVLVSLVPDNVELYEEWVTHLRREWIHERAEQAQQHARAHTRRSGSRLTANSEAEAVDVAAADWVDDMRRPDAVVGEAPLDRRSARGHVRIRVPQRGPRKALLDTVAHNAAEEFTRHRLRRSSDHNSRAKALRELQDALELEEAPLRIECFDMSHLQGSDYVGSMVVMEDGLPKPRDYRRFKVSVPGNDDFAAMYEVVSRRLSRFIADRDRSFAEPADSPRRFAYPPNLLIVDGGKGQLSSAQRAVTDLGLDGEIQLAALAKQFEELFVPGRSEPVMLPRRSEALYLVQRIRDEAHRFAITFHRELRDKRMKRSVLDDIAGLGPARRKRLLAELGGVKGVRNATRDDLHNLAWLPATVADGIYAALHTARPRS